MGSIVAMGGFTLSLRLDGLGLLFVILVLAISAPVTLYAIGHRHHDRLAFRGGGLLLGIFMLSMKDKLGPVNVQEMVALVREFKGGKKEIPLALPKPAGPPPSEGIVKLPPNLEAIQPPSGVPSPEAIKRPLPAPSGELAAQIRVGAGLYQQFCLVCHGPGGTGNTVRAAMPPIPDFTNRAWHKPKTNAELVVSILEGKGTLMPANNTRISRDQARNLVAYIRAFGGVSIEPRPAATDAEFEKSFRQLQNQWDELEKELKKIKRSGSE